MRRLECNFCAWLQFCRIRDCYTGTKGITITLIFQYRFVASFMVQGGLFLRTVLYGVIIGSRKSFRTFPSQNLSFKFCFKQKGLFWVRAQIKLLPSPKRSIYLYIWLLKCKMSSHDQDVGLDGEKNLSCIFSCSTGPSSTQSHVFKERSCHVWSQMILLSIRSLFANVVPESLCPHFLSARWGWEQGGVMKFSVMTV